MTQESLELAIDQVRAGNRLFDVCGTVEKHVKGNGFSIVREYVGHGIGTQLHEEPQVPNYVDRKNENPRLKAGMVLAVEPMVNAGKAGGDGVEGQVDGGDEGRLEFGSFRALHRGDGERAVGADEAVKRGSGRRSDSGHGGGRAAQRHLLGGAGRAAEGFGPPGGRGEDGISSGWFRAIGSRWSYRLTIRRVAGLRESYKAGREFGRQGVL